MTPILHSLGWAILAHLGTYFLLSLFAALIGHLPTDDRAETFRFIAFLVALATFLLTL